MAVKTPEYWKEYELIEEMTAYGNKVMIPKSYKCGWEMERLRHQHIQQKGQDLKEYLNELIIWLETVNCRPKTTDMVKAYWEIYETNN